MSGKAKSVYLTVTPKGQHTSVLRKTFFDAKSYNDYVKSEEFKAKWPAEQYDFIKETYWQECQMYKIYDGDLFLFAVDTQHEADEQEQQGFQVVVG